MGTLVGAVRVILSIVMSVHLGYCLYADQIGKYDWRRQFVGQISYFLFDDDANSGLAFVSSQDNVIGAIDVDKGTLVWRHVFEERAGKSAPLMVLTSNAVVTLSHDSQILRSWEKGNGILRWEAKMPKRAAQVSNIDFVPTTGDVLVQVDGQLLLFDARTGDNTDTSAIANTMQGIKWFGMVRTSTGSAILGGEAGHNFGVYQFEIGKGKITSVPGAMVLAAPWYYRQRCASIGSFLVCLAEDGRKLAYTDCGTNPPMTKGFELSSPADLIIPAANSGRYFGVRTADTKRVTLFTVDKKTESVIQMQELGQAEQLVVTKVGSGAGYLVVLEPIVSQVRWYSLKSDSNRAEMVNEWTLNMKTSSLKLPPITQIFACAHLDGSNVHRQLVTLAQDYTLDSYASNNDKVWSRPEGLSTILAVSMLELPLSENQAEIESEFMSHGDSLVMMFARRVRSQLHQLRRTLLKAADQVLSLTGLLDSIGSSAQIMSKLGYNVHNLVVESAKSKSAAVSSDDSFERDYFNLHKLIVVATATGKIYGLDNRLGGVLWQTWLSDVEPWRSTGDRLVMPLFVQRTTAHFPHPAQCALVVKSKISGKGQIVIFDPMTGTINDRIKLDVELVSVMLTPYTNDAQVHALLVTGKNGKVAVMYPSDVNVPANAQLYTMHANRPLRHSTTSGANVLFGQRYVHGGNGKGSMEAVWQTPLPLAANMYIDQVVPKQTNEHTHSQGRVLGDRSVLYKYVNPNLVVVVAVTDADNTQVSENLIHVFLVDAVNGQVVFTAKHQKSSCQNNQCRVVHCENWIVYSFWNEKARRMELNVLELYEGNFQTDPERFSSHTPTVNPPMVLKQAYIFSQGITAMGVTNTERGLTNRMVLIGLPFGGILEVPKALLDPRRPLIPTPEHREEGLIPYIPEVPVAAESILNYNQTSLRIRSIFAAPSGLESTSLVLAYGLDLYFTRLTPSGTFDILNVDFDHWFISLALLGLIVASVATKKMAKRRDLNNAWR